MKGVSSNILLWAVSTAHWKCTLGLKRYSRSPQSAGSISERTYIGFSSCAVPPLYCVLTFAEEYWGGSEPERFWRWKDQRPRFGVKDKERGSGLKTESEVQGRRAKFKFAEGQGLGSEAIRGMLRLHSQAEEARWVWYSNCWKYKQTKRDFILCWRGQV